MAIKPIEATAGIDLLREASATAANSRHSQRPPTRAPEAAPAAPPESTPDAPPQAASPSMRFHVDQDTGKTVVSLVDPANGTVLRQIPSAEALEVAKAIGKFQGMFVNLKV